jgi:hypothetical protein
VAKVMKRALKKVPEPDIYSPCKNGRFACQKTGYFFGYRHLLAD